jgi:hypothetical protein
LIDFTFSGSDFAVKRLNASLFFTAPLIGSHGRIGDDASLILTS